MKLDMDLECNKITDIEPYTAYRMGVSLEDVDLSDLCSTYKTQLLEELGAEALIEALEELGYVVTEEE